MVINDHHPARVHLLMQLHCCTVALLHLGAVFAVFAMLKCMLYSFPSLLPGIIKRLNALFRSAHAVLFFAVYDMIKCLSAYAAVCSVYTIIK